MKTKIINQNNDHQNLVDAIVANDHKSVNDIVCIERLLLYSVVYNNGKTVKLVDNLKDAKILARQICRETHDTVDVNFHHPFDSWRNFMSVFHRERRLKWYYLHVDALAAKDY